MRRAALPLTALIVAATLAGCTAPEAEPVEVEPRDDLTLTIGALLPATGALAGFGPAARAAVQLAVDDVNDAGLPVTVAAEVRDAGDGTTDTGIASVSELIGLGVNGIVGPLSDGVAKKVIDTVVERGVPMISPANSAPDFSTHPDDDLYWRTAPPCTFEADALAEQVAESGASTAALLSAAGPCGDDLIDAVTTALGREEVEIVSASDLGGGADAAVAAAVEEDAEAVVVVSPAAKDVLAPLLNAGFTGEQLFLLGLPPGDYSADFAAGALEGATVTLPGPDLPELDDFTGRLLELDPAITDFSYAPETYDAVVLLALAALQANGVEGGEIAGALRLVSGGEGEGEPCDTAAACGDLIVAGAVPDYEGVSGPITFDEAGDPAGAVIGVFRAGADNVFTRVR